MKMQSGTGPCLAEYQKIMLLKKCAKNSEIRKKLQGNNKRKLEISKSRLIKETKADSGDQIPKFNRTPQSLNLSKSISDYGINYNKIPVLEPNKGSVCKMTQCDKDCKQIVPITDEGKPSKQNSVDDPLIVQPPAGYYIRDGSSSGSKDSGFDPQKEYFIPHEPLGEEDFPQCSFGCIPWNKSFTSKLGKTLEYNNSNENIKSSAPPSPLCLSTRSESKRSPKKKMKKMKRRKSLTKKNVKHKEQSPKKNANQAHTTNAKSKKDTNFKIKSVKKEMLYPLRYQQKVLQPSNSNFYRRMKNLPVSIDSVLYYYEPHSNMVVRKGRRDVNQYKNNIKIKKNKVAGSIEKRTSCGISRKGTIDRSRTIYLDRNSNANTSDIDMGETNDGSNVKEMPLDDIIVVSSFQDSVVGDTSTIDSEAFSDALDTSYKTVDTIQENRETNLTVSAAQKFEKNAECNLSEMVDEFIQSAFKEEEEYERRLNQGSPGKFFEKENQGIEKNKKDGTFSLNIEHTSTKVVVDKTRIENDENTKRITFKPPISRPDHTKIKKRPSSSSPNLSISSKVRHTIGGESILVGTGTSVTRTKSEPHAQKLNFGIQGLRDSPITHQAQCSPGSCPKVSAKFNCSDVGECLQENERGRSKKSHECPSGSILMKSNSLSQGEKRTQSQPNKSTGKNKSNIKKKFHSVSPLPRDGPPSHTKHNPSEGPRKKTPRSGKKNKKKVRIVVDWPGFQERVKDVKDSSLQTDNCEASDKQTVNDDEQKLSCGFRNFDTSDRKQCMAKVEEDNNRKDEHFESEQTGFHESGDENEQVNTCEDHGANLFETISDQETTPSPTCFTKESIFESKPDEKKGTKKIRKNKEKKKVVAEKSSPCVPVVKDDTKFKLALKRKRYQLKKPSDTHPDKKAQVKNVEKDYSDQEKAEEKEVVSSVDGHTRRVPSPTSSKGSKPIVAKKPTQSPKGLRKRMTPVNIDQEEGSSVDAPAFNARRESVVRISKSGPLINALKSKESNAQSQNRVKLARDNFAKSGRSKISPQLSPPRLDKCASAHINQRSPIASRSTDLDLASGFKHHQSPLTRVVVPIKPTCSGVSKLGHGKLKARIDIECPKDNALEEVVPESPPKSLIMNPHLPDPMDMNVFNVGVLWMIQGIMSRLSFFKAKPEDESECSSLYSETQQVATVEGEST